MARGSVNRKVLKDGSIRWEARADGGKTPDGKRRQPLKRFKTRKEAQAFNAQTLAAANKGEIAHYAAMLVKDYLVLHWLPFYQTRHKANSFMLRESDVRLHIIPALGQYPLGKLTPALVQRFYAELEQSLAPATVRKVAHTLDAALNRAVRWEMLLRNPALGAQKPASVKRQPTIWTPAQFQQFLAAEDDPDYRCLWLLLAATGMRKGEAIALTWQDIDWHDGSIRIARTLSKTETGFVVGSTKTDGSCRVVALPNEFLTLLRGAQERQERGAPFSKISRPLPHLGAHRENGNVEEILPARSVKSQKPTQFIFTRTPGRFLHPATIDARWRRTIRLAGLPYVRIHDLRHGNATIGLIAGVPLKVISERLGHANIGITADVYSHVTRALDKDAANAIGNILLGNEVLDDGVSAAD